MASSMSSEAGKGMESYGKLWVGTGGTEEKNEWVTIDLQ
jgi:hypothetical protein